MKPRLFSVNVWLEPREKPSVRLYTAKIVKRILIAASPETEALFQPSRGAEPKLVHVTPLYKTRGEKIRAVHYTTELEPGQYTFYIGLLDKPLDPYTVYNILNIDTITIAGTTVRVKMGEIAEVDVAAIASKTLKTLEATGKLRLVFASPTILRDPLVSTKHKTLIPSTMNIFSTPVYIWLYTTGNLRYKTYMKTLIQLHRALTTPPTYLTTVKKLDLHYEPNRKIPTLIGYINLHYNPENDPKKLALDILDKTLPLTLALGTGVGRAAGLGHIHTLTH